MGKLIINCGVSHVSVSEVTTTNDDELILDRCFVQPLDYDFSDESEWLAATTTGVNSIISQNKISGKAHFILPGFLLLTKIIKVPHVETDKQQQIIAFEAQQNIPYPLAEVVWGSHIVFEDDVENEVLLLAVKKDIADGFARGMAAIGLEPVSMGASSILDYNSMRHSMTDLEDEESLIINVGARSSNLLFVNPEGFLIRTINLGGNSLTQNIADSLGREFDQSEELKTSFFSGEVEYPEHDPAVQTMWRTAEAFMKRLSQETTRSIVTYKRQKKGDAPTRIFLTGKASLLPGLAEYLSEKQRVSVDYFDPLKNITLGPNIDAEAVQIDQFNLSEVIGEACRGVGENSVGINLLPEEFKKSQAFAKKKLSLAIAAILMACIPLPGYLLSLMEISSKKDTLTQLKTQIAPLNHNLSKIKKTQEISARYMAAIDKIDGLVTSKYNWIIFLEDIQEKLFDIKDVWLDDIHVNIEELVGEKIYELEIKGRLLVRSNQEKPKKTVEPATEEGEEIKNEKDEEIVVPIEADKAEVDRLVLTERINQLRDGLKASEFIQKEKSYEIDWSTLDAGLKVLPFKLNFLVNPNKPL